MFQCSSASRKFLNFAVFGEIVPSPRVSVLFSEPKISQFPRVCQIFHCFISFSALQRAENFSIPIRAKSALTNDMFQCSSASRKFLNSRDTSSRLTGTRRFQCSSASRKFLNSACRERARVRQRVSVLFSEPKISQLMRQQLPPTGQSRFSALQRAENFSIQPLLRYFNAAASGFSALQRAENFSIRECFVLHPSG